MPRHQLPETATAHGLDPEQARRLLEQSAVRELIRDQDSLWHILFEGSRDGIVVLDQEGRVYEANRRFATMLGYTLEEVRTLHVWDWDNQFSAEELRGMIRQIDGTGQHFETQQVRRDGSVIDVELSNSATMFRGQKMIFCICRDITERKKAEARIHLLATTDSLTGLLNRGEFGRRLDREIDRARRYTTPLSLILYDLDHFKRVNDSFGHPAGDEVLREPSRLVREKVRCVDCAARGGGEEFIVLLPQTGLEGATST
ncbi:MAG: diguanylate cyclase, partial [Desulfobulbaceae bacterium]|nr:diguanylate cyclase [Desulfobulbaceae bacterium]